jgi:DNA-binding winged helix-turn-helix (wHTH) protein
MRVRFADFTFDDDQHRLLRGTDPLHLSPKEYELLKLLITHRPNALSKADIHNHLWPSTFVSEVSLAAVVARVRSALGEHSRGGQFIRTIHGFGYAFVAETTDTSSTDPGAACWLIWRNQRIPLREGTQVIGRSGDAQIPIEAESVSRRHASLKVTRTTITLEDLGSKNGTWARGERVTEPITLEDGDEILLGPERLTFHSLLRPGRTKTHA